MRLSYNYFLQRRKVTTKSLIEINKVKTYDEFVNLLERLRVTPPIENIFNNAYLEINHVKELKGSSNKKAIKSDDDIQKKATASSRSKARRAGGKRRSSGTSRKSRVVLEEKPFNS